MGYSLEFNWVLKLSDADLTRMAACEANGLIFEFEKEGERIYPLRMPIDIVDAQWQVHGRGRVIEVCVGEDRTKGKLALETKGRGASPSGISPSFPIMVTS